MNQRYPGLWQHVAFWIVIPLVLAIARLMIVPEPRVFALAPLVFNFLMVLLGWAAFHLSTKFAAHFLIPRSWRESKSLVFCGLYALSIGSLLGSALLFPTRPLRAELYCLMVMDPSSVCDPLGLSARSWANVGEFLRLSALNLFYWVVANQLVAWLFDAPRYGFPLNRTGFNTGPGRGDAANAPGTPEEEAISPLLSRLPLELGDDPILLVANEHYLDVHTRKGSAMVLYRLSDAAKELGDRGVRVHRSYWVASEAICGIKKKGSALHVVLENGMTAPVSRGNRHLFNSEKYQRMLVR